MLIARVPDDAPVYVADQAVLDAIAGFHLHRGILALGEKPEPATLEAVLAALAPRRCRGRGLRHRQSRQHGRPVPQRRRLRGGGGAAGRPCCDPFYRKAIRVSVGAVLRTPMAAGLDASTMIDGAGAGGRSRSWP